MLKKLNFFSRKITIDVLKNESFKSISEMPGPRGFLGLGNFFNYTKTFGNYRLDELHKAGFDKYHKYGPIVCERMLPGVSVVWLYNPNDIAQIFNDSPSNPPCRRSHLALDKIRRDQPDVYNNGGLLPTNGEEWWKMRSVFQKGLSSPQNVRQFLPRVDEMIRDFVNVLMSRLNGNVAQDMVEELQRLNLELTCLLAFDERLNSFSEREFDENSLSSKLIEATNVINSKTLELDQGFMMWRFIESDLYKKVKKAVKLLQDTTTEFTEKRIKENRVDGNSLLDQYLNNPKIDKKDIIGVSNDLILAGIHTLAFTEAFALHHISKNRQIQDLMYEEAKKVLPNENDEITPQIINSEIPYIRAVLKETYRLNPVSIGIGRILNHDTILGGYLVPKNSNVVTMNFIACRLEENFTDALKFKPERWLKSSIHQKLNVNPYLVIPFGHGIRSCIARRFAEQSMLVLLLRLMRSYTLEWKGDQDEVDIKTELINVPNSDITIQFKKREN